MAEPKYHELLRQAIDDAGLSRRKLSVALAAMTGNQQASEFRSLGKYLSGEQLPDDGRAAALAVLLRNPGLALADRYRPRRDRLRELEERVAEIERSRLVAGDAIYSRLGDLEEAVARLEQPRFRRGSQNHE